MSRETKYINLYAYQNYPEELILAKIDIEKNKERTKIVDFLSSLACDAFFSNDCYIAFTILSGNQYDYVIYCGINDEQMEESGALESLKKHLERISYDISKLKRKTNVELINDENSSKEYFLIDGQYYV